MKKIGMRKKTYHHLHHNAKVKVKAIMSLECHDLDNVNKKMRHNNGDNGEHDNNNNNNHLNNNNHHLTTTTMTSK